MKSLATAIWMFIILFCSLNAIAQESEVVDSTIKTSKLSWSAFVDVYYSYDFNKPQNHEKAPFLYNHKRHIEFTANLALIKLSYEDVATRANIALMAGIYPQYNQAAEPELLRNVFEANAGVRISKKKALWIDAGIMPSHIGFESAVSMDNWTLTRSILAENSPYYEAGVKLSYTSPGERWHLAGLLLNGWQRIRRVEGNNTPAFGTQVTYTPTDKVSFNWSTFIGNDKPDTIKKWRYFNNIYSVWQPSEKLGITFGLDYGLEQKETNSSRFNTWYTPVIIIRYQINKWAVAGRAEYYSDTKGVIVPLVNNTPFQMQGHSFNIDRKISDKILWRLEGRLFKNRAPYFLEENTLSKYNSSITTSIAINLERY